MSIESFAYIIPTFTRNGSETKTPIRFPSIANAQTASTQFSKFPAGNISLVLMLHLVVSRPPPGDAVFFLKLLKWNNYAFRMERPYLHGQP